MSANFFNSRNDGFAIPVGNYIMDMGIGSVHYCSNRNYEIDNKPFYRCENGELAIMDSEGEFVTESILTEMGLEGLRNDNEVIGYVTPEQFAKIFIYLNSKS